MKRILSIILIFVVAFSLVACAAAPSKNAGSGNITQDTTQETTGNAQTPDNTPSGETKPVDTPTVTGPVDEKQAKEIALKHAGVAEDQIRDYEIEKKQIGGVSFFEIDFESGDYEYEYLIRIDNGKILENSKDLDRD